MTGELRGQFIKMIKNQGLASAFTRADGVFRPAPSEAGWSMLQCLGRIAVPLIPTTVLAGPPTTAGPERGCAAPVPLMAGRLGTTGLTAGVVWNCRWLGL